MSDKERALEWLKIVDSGYSCTNAPSFVINIVRQYLQKPDIDVEGLKREIGAELCYTIRDSYSDNTMFNTIDYLNNKGYIRAPLPEIEGLDKSIKYVECGSYIINGKAHIDVIEAAKAYLERMEK